ncbi:hypothetical protein QYM36_008462, partial [Artemia franciscana]
MMILKGVFPVKKKLALLQLDVQVIISDVRALPSGRARSCGRVAVPARAELQLRLVSS